MRDVATLLAVMLQVKYLMGLKVPRFDKLQETCRNLVENLNYFNWREYVVRASDAVHRLVSVSWQGRASNGAGYVGFVVQAGSLVLTKSRP